MVEIPSLLELLKSGVHFGHRVSKRHPKMDPYIFSQKNGVHIINLEITQEKLREALDFVKRIAASGGTILFLATKKQAQKIIQKQAQDCGMPYVTERWLGGTLTNFSTISKVIEKFNDLKKKQESGEFEKYTKKEQLEFDREIERLEKMVGGIKGLKKVPEAIFICDARKEKTAVREAKKTGIPIVATTDTNVNPEDITYPIPANDDAIKSIDLIISLICQAIKEGQKEKKPESGKEKASSIDSTDSQQASSGRTETKNKED